MCVFFFLLFQTLTAPVSVQYFVIKKKYYDKGNKK